MKTINSDGQSITTYAREEFTQEFAAFGTTDLGAIEDAMQTELNRTTAGNVGVSIETTGRNEVRVIHSW